MSGSPPGSLWLIGCGNMAGAMLRQWIASGAIDPATVFVVNRHDRELPEGVQQGRALPEGPLPDAVMLGVKPQQIAAAAELHAARIAGVPLLISILAGAEEAVHARHFAADTIVRALPNLPVSIGKGVTTLYSGSADATARATAEALMRPLGLVEWIDNEALFGSATTLHGCGPAFVYRFIDALAAAGTSLGMPPEQAQRLAVATVEGSGLLAAQAGEPPATLADRVASPGGSTREGMNVLDRDDALRNLLRETLAASARRDAEMVAEARE